MSGRNAASQVIGDVCLYGSHACGIGYLTATPGGVTFGDGEPRKHWGLTDALWTAAVELRGAGFRAGTVRVFAPGGGLMATMDVQQLRYAGELEWAAAPVMTISYDDLMAAAE